MKDLMNQFCKGIQRTFSDLDAQRTCSKRELLLGTIACFAVGMVVGLVCSPKKTVTIGSHNGNNSAATMSTAAMEEAEEEAEKEAEEE